MTMRGFTIGVTAVFLGLAVLQEPALHAQGAAKKKVFIDQDLGGAMGTDNQSILMLLQAPEIDEQDLTGQAGSSSTYCSRRGRAASGRAGESRGVTNEQEERSGGCSAWDASATPPARLNHPADPDHRWSSTERSERTDETKAVRRVQAATEWSSGERSRRDHLGLPADEVEKGGCCSLWSPYVPRRRFLVSGRFTRPLWSRPKDPGDFCPQVGFNP